MNQKPLTTSEDLIRAFAQAMDLINPELQNHHQQVAYLSLKIAEEMDLPETDRQKVFFGALLHDVGGVIVRKEVSLRELEADPKFLARAGASLLRTAAARSSYAIPRVLPPSGSRP
jgi:response regulator RpfG family c-di-GMP phosphodiesterase